MLQMEEAGKLRLVGWWLVLTAVLFVTGSIACPETCHCKQKGRGQRVECHHDNLTSIMPDLPHNTARLVLDDILSIHTLGPTYLAEAPRSILELTITNSTLQGLEESTFSSTLNSMLELDLSRNSIQSISPGAFTGLSSLRLLNLSSNHIYDLGTVLAPLVSLQSLDLSHNYIRGLQSKTLQAQSSLTYLRLDGNKFHDLTGAAFQTLTFLTELRVRSCNIFMVSEDFFAAIPRIRVLDLGKNHLVEFPSSSSFSYLQQLKHLFLDGNEFVQLPHGQLSGVNLITLSLAQNRITAVPSGAFNGLTVEDLDLSENKLIELKADFLQPVAPRLVALNVAFNPIRDIDPFTFRVCRLLQTLNISACSLTNLPAEVLRGLYRLKKIDISWNHLHNISEEVMQLLKRLEVVSLQHNAWHCNCGIVPLRNWLRSPRSASKLSCLSEDHSEGCTDLQCVSPDLLAGRLVLNLDDSEVTDCPLAAAKRGLSVPVQVGIAVACLVFSLGMLFLTVYLWRRGKTRKSLKQFIFQRKRQPESYDEEDEEDERIEPFVDCDNESLKQSHRSFVVRHYFDQMVTDPKLLEPTSPSQAGPAESHVMHTQKDSMYSSSPSLYNVSHKTASVVVVGIESAV